MARITGAAVNPNEGKLDHVAVLVGPLGSVAVPSGANTRPLWVTVVNRVVMVVNVASITWPLVTCVTWSTLVPWWRRLAALIVALTGAAPLINARVHLVQLGKT